MQHFCEHAIRRKRVLVSLDLSANKFGVEGARCLPTALRLNQALKEMSIIDCDGDAPEGQRLLDDLELVEQLNAAAADKNVELLLERPLDEEELAALAAAEAAAKAEAVANGLLPPA